MRLSVLAALAAVVLAPSMGNAQTFRAINDLDVVPLRGGLFEVIEARGEGARGIWCAAAEYAERRLGARGRLYVAQARGKSVAVAGRKSVVFTLNEAILPQGAFRSTSVSTAQVGLGLPIAHAIQFCRNDDRDKFDLNFERN